MLARLRFIDMKNEPLLSVGVSHEMVMMSHRSTIAVGTCRSGSPAGVVALGSGVASKHTGFM